MANSSELKTMISNAGSNMHFAGALPADRTNAETLLSVATVRNQNKYTDLEQIVGQQSGQYRPWTASG